METESQEIYKDSNTAQSENDGQTPKKQKNQQVIIQKKSARIQNSSNIKINYKKQEIIDDLSPQRPRSIKKEKKSKNKEKEKNKEKDTIKEKEKEKEKNKEKKENQSEEKYKTESKGKTELEIEQEKERQKELLKQHKFRLRQELKIKKKKQKMEKKLEKEQEKAVERLSQVQKQSLIFDASNLIDLKKKKQKEKEKETKKLQNIESQQQQQYQQQINSELENDNNQSQSQVINQPQQATNTNFMMKDDKQIEKEKEKKAAKAQLRRKPLANRKLFDPYQHQQHLIQRDAKQKEVDEFHEKYGQLIEKVPEPTPVQTHWDYVLKEMADVQEYMRSRKSFIQFRFKKIAKHSINMLQNIRQSKEQKKKLEEQRIKRLAKDMGQIVHRQYWNNVKKVQRFQIQLEEQRNIKEQSKEKLQNLVSQQLKFTQKFADLINPEKQKEKALRTSEGEAMSEQSSSDNDDGSSSDEEQDIIINLTKINEKEYKYDNIVLDKKRANKWESLEQLYNFAQEFKNENLGKNEQNIKQPYLLKFNLRSYQLVGMNWLSTLQDKKMNGILADEMGLGKTIQTIAMLANLTCQKGIWGPHLIIVPTSIIINWEIEFKKWCPSFKILTYYGNQRERYLKRQGWSKMNHFQVCITTYKLALQDQKMFKRKKWYYMILDEAQHIKNFKSQRWQVLLNFQTRHRLLLTGTPLQNDVGELWSLLHFLMPKVFDSHSDFMQWFSIPMQQAIQKNLPISKDILQKLHSILRPFLLRRLKKDVEKQLPTKQEYIIKCPLSRRQRYLYDEFINRDVTKKHIHKQDFLGLMNIVMQLKKVCNHPDLFEPRTIESGVNCQRLKYVISYHYFLNAYKVNVPNKFQILKNELNEPGKYFVERRKQLCWQGNDFQYFIQQELQFLVEQDESQVLIPPFKQRWIRLQRETKFNNLSQVNYYNKKNIDENHVIYGYDTLQFLSLRQNPNLGSDVYYFKKSKQYIKQKVYKKFNEDEEDENQIEQELDQNQNNQDVPEQQYYYHKYLEMSEFQPSQIFQKQVTRFQYLAQEFMFSQQVNAQPVELVISPYHQEFHNNYRLENKRIVEKAKPLRDQFHYFQIRQLLYFPNKKLLMYDCGKLNTMVQLLKKLKDRGDKCLIFTQMSKMLDIFENILNLFNFSYVRLDGMTKIENRQKVVERFNGDPKMFCFISSTRAGGIGLNLTGANCVIFYDTDWNPAMDRQAQDRCHRIGQTRNVSIYRLISEATIEENILLKSIQKQKLDQYIMEEGEFNIKVLQDQSKFNVKDILGNMVQDSSKMVTIDQKQYQKALENVEDVEDAQATKLAVQEQNQYQQEGLAEAAELDKEEGKEEEEFKVEDEKFPSIFKYGYKFIKHEQEIRQLEDEEEEDDEDEENEIEEEGEDEGEENVIEEDDEEEQNNISADDKNDQTDDEKNTQIKQKKNNKNQKKKNKNKKNNGKKKKQQNLNQQKLIDDEQSQIEQDDQEKESEEQIQEQEYKIQKLKNNKHPDNNQQNQIEENKQIPIKSQNDIKLKEIEQNQVNDGISNDNSKSLKNNKQNQEENSEQENSDDEIQQKNKDNKKQNLNIKSKKIKKKNQKIKSPQKFDSQQQRDKRETRGSHNLQENHNSQKIEQKQQKIDSQIKEQIKNSHKDSNISSSRKSSIQKNQSKIKENKQIDEQAIIQEKKYDQLSPKQQNESDETLDVDQLINQNLNYKTKDMNHEQSNQIIRKSINTNIENNFNDINNNPNKQNLQKDSNNEEHNNNNHTNISTINNKQNNKKKKKGKKRK